MDFQHLEGIKQISFSLTFFSSDRNLRHSIITFCWKLNSLAIIARMTCSLWSQICFILLFASITFYKFNVLYHKVYSLQKLQRTYLRKRCYIIHKKLSSLNLDEEKGRKTINIYLYTYIHICMGWNFDNLGDSFLLHSFHSCS